MVRRALMSAVAKFSDLSDRPIRRKLIIRRKVHIRNRTYVDRFHDHVDFSAPIPVNRRDHARSFGLLILEGAAEGGRPADARWCGLGWDVAGLDVAGWMGLGWMWLGWVCLGWVWLALLLGPGSVVAGSGAGRMYVCADSHPGYSKSRCVLGSSGTAVSLPAPAVALVPRAGPRPGPGLPRPPRLRALTRLAHLARAK